MRSKLLKAAFLAYAFYFVLGAFLTPHFAHTHQYELADHYYEVFSASCQQQASRSFWFEGYPMALCARCLGNYIGFILLGLVWVFKPGKICVRLFLLMLVPGLGEKVLEYLGWEGNNLFRFGAGLCLGGAILTTIALICQFVWRKLKTHELQKAG